MDPGGEILDDRKVSHADRAEMERFFGEFEQGTDVVMEATFNWPWVADLAEKCGPAPHLGDPMRIKDYRKGLPKSDRKDTVGQGNLWIRKMFPDAPGSSVIMAARGGREYTDVDGGWISTPATISEGRTG